MVTKLSSNMSREYKEKICLCYTNDQQHALLTTKKDADTHSKDLDEYVRHHSLYPVPELTGVLGTLVRTSNAYHTFLDKHMSLIDRTPHGVLGCKTGLSWIHPLPPAVAEWYRKYDDGDWVHMTAKDWEQILERSDKDLELSALQDVVRTLQARNKT